MKTTILLLVTLVLIFSNTAISQQTNVLSDPLFNGPEGIIYDEDENQYIVGNANDGKLLIIDNNNNVSVFKENIGANAIMAFEIIGDSLLISTNEPRTLTCINKNTGDPIYQLIIDSISNACSQLAYDDRFGYLYLVDQYGAVLKADVKNAFCNIFTESLSQGTQAIEIDTIENRLIVFSWPTSLVKFININDSTDITNGPATGITKCTSTTMDNAGYIYVSSWSGHKVMKMHIDSLNNPEIFCNDSLYQPVGITYNANDRKFAVCNFGNNTITFIQENDTITSVESKINESLYNINAIYNPSLNKIFVEFETGLQKKYQIRLINGMGRSFVKKTIEITGTRKNNVQLSTAGLQKGIYLVLIENAECIVGVKKIILN
jgi:DNA-binding beta-propeller fold protein YncE